MNERVVSVYRKLFEMRVLHHYWLDEGGTVFDLMTDTVKKAQRLQSYDVRKILSLSPTAKTEKLLKAYGCMAKTTAHGIVVVTPNTLPISSETVFEWTLTVKDSGFFQYTAMTLTAQPIYRLFDNTRRKMYSFKENVPVLSNTTGATRGEGENRTLFLSGEYGALTTDDKIEALISSGNRLDQLISDQPGGVLKAFDTPLSQLPVFVHQGDIPAITPPEGVAGAPSRGILLEDTLSESAFALIKIKAFRADNPAFSPVGPTGFAKAKAPVFDIRFKNRSTVRRYISRDGAVVFEESEPLPLTYFGVVGTRQKPSVGLPKIKRESSENPRITGLISEIFI